MIKRFQESVNFIKKAFNNCKAETFVVLGTGMNMVSDEFTFISSLKYIDIPNFPRSTVQDHAGELLWVKTLEKEILILSGRFHYYEGYSMKEVTYAIRTMQFFGLKEMICCSAVGSLNPSFKKGDIVMIKDHINFFPDNPLRGTHHISLGDRFPDMTKVYSHSLEKKAQVIAKEEGIILFSGVYLGVPGPSLETPAELGFYRSSIGDVIGMSTIPEVIVAHQARMKIGVFTIIANECFHDNLPEVSIESVIRTVNLSIPNLVKILYPLLSVIK